MGNKKGRSNVTGLRSLFRHWAKHHSTMAKAKRLKVSAEIPKWTCTDSEHLQSINRG